MRGIWIAWAVIAALGFSVYAVETETVQDSPDSELLVMDDFLFSEAVPLEAKQFTFFFTTYALPTKSLREDCEAALPFVLNSTISIKSTGTDIVKPTRVPGSKTLWYIDVRDYGWTDQTFADIAPLQPYFLAPLVSKAGGRLFRADWLIVFGTDNTRLSDKGVKDLPYYILQYGKGKEPKNAAEFLASWKVDVKSLEEEQIEQGTIVNAGDSGVSQHTRQLRFGRTIFGWVAQTRDVKSHDIDPDKVLTRDYIEDVFARQSDAGEYIASNKRRLQTYFLTAGVNKNFARVEDGDVGIVVHRLDPIDVRVRTAKGCMDCHAMGYIPSTNAIRDLYRLGGDLYAKDKELQRAIRAFYLGNLKSVIEQNNKMFEDAVKDCNGLDPIENAKAYKRVYDWYVSKVTLEQAARECGVTVEAYKKSIAKTVSGRLVFLYHGQAMPRDVWDTNVITGGYIQSMLYIKHLDQSVMQKPEPGKVIEANKNPGNKENEPFPAEAEVIVNEVRVLKPDGSTSVYLGRGVRVRVLRREGDKFFIRSGENEGFAPANQFK